MKIKCKVCRKETEINELEYTPGDKIVVECARCGNELEAVIPLREEAPEERPQVKVVDNDLKSVWYASASNEKKESDTAKNVRSVEASQGRAIPPANQPTTQNAYQTTPPVPPTSNRNSTNSVCGNGGTPLPPYSPYPSKDNQSSTGKTILFVVLGVVIAGISIWLFTRNSGNGGYPNDLVVDSVYETVVEAVEPAEDPRGTDYNTEGYYDEPETVVATVEEVAESPAEYGNVARVFIPAMGTTTSSEAYDVYPPYLTDDKFGDAWATTDIVQNAIRNGMVDCFVKGEGDIEGYPLSIDAVRLKNGRFYGRYHNDYNGVKLDINGGFDEYDNLIIKLGHKSETSYWVLRYEGMNDDGSLQYRGSWGRKDKPTGLRITIYSK